MSPSRIIVVGAGLGGLAAAIRLQAAGHSVTLLEKRAQLGGRAAQLRAAGYTFDMGPSIITAPHLLRDLWASANARIEDDVELVPLAPYYRIYFADGRHFDYGGAQDQVEAQIRAFDPRAVNGYRRFMAATRHIYRRAFDDLAGQPFHELGTFLKLVPELLRLNAAQSVYDFVSRFFPSPQLRMVFSFHPLFIGGNPFRASAIYSIVPYLESQGGVWFARGGMYAVVEAMHALFSRLGGQTRLSTAVEEVLVDDRTRRATGVRLARGESLTAEAVVLNADVATAYTQLVPARYRRRMSDRRLHGYRYSMSCFLLYLGLDRQYSQLLHHTIIMAPRYRELIRDIFDGQGLPSDMSLYLHAPTKTDHTMAPHGGESLYVLVPVPHLGRGIDWTREAQPFRDRIVRFLERDFGLTGLEQSIKFEQRYTPLDFRDDLSSYLGSAFSIEPTLLQSAYFRPHNASEDVAGLYLVGAGTHPGAGIPGVLLSASITSRLVTDTVGRPAPVAAASSMVTSVSGSLENRREVGPKVPRMLDAVPAAALARGPDASAAHEAVRS
ncbi:MAG: phytoene desaturase family protein [Chloroflexota bacterium]